MVIDDLPAHKAAGFREAIEVRGATLRYPPQYSLLDGHARSLLPDW
jgi:hypothetical protein